MDEANKWKAGNEGGVDGESVSNGNVAKEISEDADVANDADGGKGGDGGRSKEDDDDSDW